MKHPQQPIEKDLSGQTRFKVNKIVAYLQDYARERGCGASQLQKLPFDQEDWKQFLQLIGYSVGRYEDLGYSVEAVPGESQAEPGAASETEVRDALLNMLGAFDTPLRRQRFPSDFGDEVCAIARSAVGKNMTV